MSEQRKNWTMKFCTDFKVNDFVGVRTSVEFNKWRILSKYNNKLKKVKP